MALGKKSKLFWWIGILIFIMVILAVFSDLIVKYLWLDGLGYSQVFWKIKGTQFILFFVALIVALLYIGVNIRFITKGIKPLYLNLGQSPEGIPNVINIRPKRVKLILYGLAFLIGIFFAFSWLFQWNDFFR